MSAEIIDGKAIASEIKEELRARIEKLGEKGVIPKLVAVQVGEQPASRVYVNSQKKSCEELGIEYSLEVLDEDISEENYTAHVKNLNGDDSVTGIILQQPFPEGWNETEIQAMITPPKDVEGMSPGNQGWVMYNRNDMPAPCTARAALELIRRSGTEIRGADITIVGRSEIVGKPLALMLIALHATVSVVHTKTKDFDGMCRNADILCVAAGRAGLINGDQIKPGAVVIDVGINRIPALDKNGKPLLNDKGKPKKRTVGDVDYESAVKTAGKITPVPGGVGPVTVAILLENVVKAAENRQEV